MKLLLFINFLFYISFLLLDWAAVTPPSFSYILKYATIVCAFLLSVPSFYTIPLFITIIADFILLFCDNNTLGVFVFSFAHLFYIIQNSSYINISQKLGILFLCILCISPVFFGPLYGACGLYGVLFFINFSAAYEAMKKKPSKKNKLFFGGLILFVLCDIHTVLFQLTGDIFYLKLLWLFYTPSQCIISLSKQNAIV